MIASLSLPTTPAPLSAVPAAASTATGTSGFAQALSAAERTPEAPSHAPATPVPHQPSATRSPAAAKPVARALAGMHTPMPAPGRPEPDAPVPASGPEPGEDADHTACTTGHEALPSLQALLNGLQAPLDPTAHPDRDAQPSVPATEAAAPVDPCSSPGPLCGAIRLEPERATTSLPGVTTSPVVPDAVALPAMMVAATSGVASASAKPATQPQPAAERSGSLVPRASALDKGPPAVMALNAAPPRTADPDALLIEAGISAQPFPQAKPATDRISTLTPPLPAAEPGTLAPEVLSTLVSPVASPATTPTLASAGPLQAAQAQISAGLHSEAFAPEFGAQICTFARSGVQRAQLQLNPAEMGPVSVQILVEGGSAQVHLWAEQAPTRQALELAMPSLASQLRDSGLTLTGGGVFEQPRQAPDQARREADNGTRQAAQTPAEPESLVLAAPTRRRGVVDLIA